MITVQDAKDEYPMKPLTDQITTGRLVLRRIGLADRDAVQAAAGRFEVADTMISIPHPLTAAATAGYIRQRLGQMRRGRALALGIRTRAGGDFAGLLELRAIEPEHAQGELSFWLAVEARGRGYMGEAITALLPTAFGALGLNRIYAYHMVRNPASGRVLERLGFRPEGVLRERVRKWERFEDVVIQALLRSRWSGDKGPLDHENAKP
jgi:[ribosomal protein S5]-alanine N-acetyltransferase